MQICVNTFERCSGMAWTIQNEKNHGDDVEHGDCRSEPGKRSNAQRASQVDEVQHAQRTWMIKLICVGLWKRFWENATCHKFRKNKICASEQIIEEQGVRFLVSRCPLEKNIYLVEYVENLENGDLLEIQNISSLSTFRFRRNLVNIGQELATISPKFPTFHQGPGWQISHKINANILEY